MEASSLWQAIGWLSTIDLSGDDQGLSSGDLASLRTFESWVRRQLEELRKSLNEFALESTLKDKVKSI